MGLGNKREFFFVSLITILATILIARGMTRPFEYDELYTAFFFVDTKSFWETISTYLAFNNHIGFSVIARVFLKLFGKDEWIVRLPAIIFGGASVPAFYVLCRYIFNGNSALVSTFLFAISPFLVLQASMARGYSALTFFSILSASLFLKLVRSYTKNNLILLIIVNSLAHYFHLYGFFITLTELFVVLLISLKNRISVNRNIVLALFGSILLSAILYLPAATGFYQSMTHFHGRAFNPSFPSQLLHAFVGNISNWLSCAFGLLLLIGALSFFKKDLLIGLFSASILLLPLAIAWSISPRFLYPRFFAFAVPFFVLLCGSGINSFLRSKFFVLKIMSIVFTVLLSYHWLNTSVLPKPTEGFREAVRLAEIDATNNAPLCSLGGGAPLYGYYTKREIVTPSSFDEFVDLKTRVGSVICLYRPSSWEPEHHKKIADYIKKNGTYKAIDNIEFLEFSKNRDYSQQ